MENYTDLGMSKGTLWAISEKPLDGNEVKNYNVATLNDIVDLQFETSMSYYNKQIRMEGKNGKVFSVNINLVYRISSPNFNVVSWKKKGKLYNVEWGKMEDTIGLPAILVKRE